MARPGETRDAPRDTVVAENRNFAEQLGWCYMKLAQLVDALDAYFRVRQVGNDFAWSGLYPEPYWREFAEPGYEALWNGLMVRGGEEVRRAATCVFPTDHLLAALEPGTFLFSEHAADFTDEAGFFPLARSTFEAMRQRGISFYQVHLPLDVHPEVSPSRLCAGGMGLADLHECFPVCDLPGGAVVIGQSSLTLTQLAQRLHAFLGEEVPVQVLTRPREQAGCVAVAAGGGADPAALEESLRHGCTTYVTGNAATRCRLAFAQEGLRAFRTRADEAGVALIDGTHYGTEKPPQLAMVKWFQALGIDAEFLPDVPR
jgi:putative NIF3 family GTP cyclohydrolase 1 type 2